MSTMKPDQQRVSTLLLDTVTLLCRNGLTYKNKLTVQGLIGITVDDSEVFIVHINENVVEEEQGNAYDKEHSKAPTQSFQASGGESVDSPQFAASCSRVTTSKTRIGKIHNNLNTSEIQYDQGVLGGSCENDDVIDIKSEGEEDEMDSSLKLSDDMNFQQILTGNKPTHCKQEMNDVDRMTGDGTFDTVQPKLEPNYDFNMTSNYPTFSSNDEQVLEGFGVGDQLDYQAMGEGYAEDEDVQEDDEKPDYNSPSASFSSWEQQRTQFASNRHPLPGRRISSFSQKIANKRLKMNASSTHFSRGFAHVGQRFPQHQRHPAAIASFSLKGAESSAANADETIKTMTTFICNIDGCTSSFTLKSNLLRHQTNKHGRAKKQRRSIMDAALLYDQYDVSEDN